MIRRALQIATIAVAAIGWATAANAGDPEDPARIRRAIAYLDARQDEWSHFAKAQRGEGADKTACVSCHTGLSYALARPALRLPDATPDSGGSRGVGSSRRSASAWSIGPTPIRRDPS